ncbi:hypothetical protein J2127_001366, partial [Methanococcus voltae]|nr:hypothetical protein [Methanococcus voltae]
NKNNLTVVAQDNLGNEATEEVIYVVDAEAPTFSGVRPVNDHVFIDDKNIIIKAVVNDENIDTVKAIITPVDGASLPAETLSLKGNVYQSNPIAGLTNGTYLFTITAKDTLGNENTTEEYNFSVKLVSNDTVKEALKNINISADVWDEINISNVTTEEEEGFNVTSINLNNETLEIPVMKNVSTNISKELIIKLKKSNEKAKELKTTLKTSAEAQDSLNKIKEAMADAKVLNNGFNVTNVTSEMTVNSNKVSANLKFIANNTTKKGYVIFRIPLSDFTVKGVSIKVNDKKHAITTEKSEFGWYKLLDNDGARELELTLLQDPEVDVEFEKTLPTTSSGSSSSSNNRGSRHHSTSDSITTSSMISGSKIVYANLDKDYAKSLKSSVCECTEGLKIDDDTIIVGGPLANALTKEYMNQFPVSITNSNPGENKGTIQMMTIKSEGTGIVTEYNIVLLAGSDRFGTQAAVEYFKTLEEVPEEPIYVEWTSSGVKVVNN